MAALFWFASVFLALIGINGVVGGFTCLDSACTDSKNTGVLAIVFAVICAGIAFAITKIRNLK